MTVSRLALLALMALSLLLAACRQPPFTNQPKYKTYSTAPGWPNDQSAREPPAGTVARGEPLGPVPEKLPMPLTHSLLKRGHEQFNIYCTPCHGLTGYGNGMVVQRGFPSPPSYHSERLRNAPLRLFYDVITNGYGIMYSYADRVAPADRWAIAAYIRALQLSQSAKLTDLTPAQRAKLEGKP